MKYNFSELNFSIEKIKNLNFDEWDRFVQASSEGNFFSTTDYWKVYHSEAHFLLLRVDGQIIAGLPFAIQNVFPVIGRFFKFCRAETSVIVIEEIEKEQVDEIKYKTLQYLMSFLKQNSVILFSITSKIRTSDGEVFKKIGFKTGRTGTYKIDLTQDVNDIYRNFSKGHKSSVQKAIKSNVEIKFYDSEEAKSRINEFIELQGSLFDRKKDTFSVLYLKSDGFVKEILDSTYHKCYMAIAYYNNRPAAGAILVTFKGLIYYYLGASDFSLTRESQAANLLQFEIIKFAKSEGRTVYDFGTADVVMNPQSPMYGVYLFKKNFGGYIEEYDSASFVLNPSRYRLMKYLNRLLKYKFFSTIFSLVKKV